MPDPSPARARLKSYDEWMSIREKLNPPLPENGIFRLPYINASTANDLLAQGVETVEQITDTTVFGKSTRRYIDSMRRGSRAVDHEALAQFLERIEYPVYYFDYETSQSLVPPWDGVRPYQQVPFQYSLHVQQTPDSQIEHREYLHRDSDNPMPALLTKLRSDLGEQGSVLVWYAPFETSRNKEMAELYPEHAEFLNDLNDRIVDLMTPFANETICDPAFKGSASIKKVCKCRLSPTA